METLICAVFIVHNNVERMVNSIDDLKADLRRRPEDGGARPVNGTGGSVEVQPGSRSYAVRRLQCIHLLVTQYVCALFLMGIWVRDCHWKLQSAGTGTHVHKLLYLQATCLLALRLKRGHQQYLANTLLALLQWQPHMDAFPAMAWCEEKLEATISVLAADAGGDMTSANAQRLHHLYVTQGCQRAKCTTLHGIRCHGSTLTR